MLSGSFLFRYAERQFLGLLFQEPPRFDCLPQNKNTGARNQKSGGMSQRYCILTPCPNSHSTSMPPELPIIQKTYDLIKWYVPILNKLPRDHRFQLGDRMVAALYDLLESLILARYQRHKLTQLLAINSKLDVLRYQTRLLLDFKLLSQKRYQYVGQWINDIGTDLGGWIKQQQEAEDRRSQKPVLRSQKSELSRSS
jgi:hypothetical protein